MTFLIFLISMRLSSNILYMVPRKKRGLRNCSMRVCIIMMSPVVMRPVWTQQAARIMLKVSPVPKITRCMVLRMPRLNCTWQFLAQQSSRESLYFYSSAYQRWKYLTLQKLLKVQLVTKSMCFQVFLNALMYFLLVSLYLTVKMEQTEKQATKERAKRGELQQSSMQMLPTMSRVIGKKYWVKDLRLASKEACALNRLNIMCRCEPLKQNYGPRLSMCLQVLEVLSSRAMLTILRVYRLRICSKNTDPEQHRPNPRKAKSGLPVTTPVRVLMPILTNSGPPKKQILLTASSPQDLSKALVMVLSLWMKGITYGFISVRQLSLSLKVCFCLAPLQVLKGWLRPPSLSVVLSPLNIILMTIDITGSFLTALGSRS